ncbi:unnamed protein product [Rotaria sordida]|uniref:C2H2-type domain-containing protein n=1 Tax=Rotaria sordida TaxID=392033 RepID=A0A819QTF3_9BILA|nr:unnamed protein product [Rotaria sordida]CAF1476345.1 unnamed protein product [Rotaria sordida]CAF4034669.1 unnamed protein product [Rotaria sordida]CAF4101134.1 unnamed protein product [Rotaria sordida]
MLAVGYSDKWRVFIVRNSWGTKWGNNGYVYIPYDYMENKEYCLQAVVIKNIGAKTNEFHGWTCSSCMKEENIPTHPHYLCLSCVDYHQCEKCFNKRVESQEHDQSHSMQKIQTKIKASKAADNTVITGAKYAASSDTDSDGEDEEDGKHEEIEWDQDDDIPTPSEYTLPLIFQANAQFSTDCVSFWFTYQRVFRSFNTIRARRATLYVYDGINQTIIERIPIAYCKQMGYQKLFLSNFIMNCYQVVIK